ncbi:MAG: glycosyltransferase [Hyphomicrobium sp.]|nr:glycosyltransferase [Hyphomicrobium sp.]
MRVLHLIDNASRRAGGVFESVRGLTSALQALGLDPLVVAPDDPDVARDRAAWGDVAVHVVPGAGASGVRIAAAALARDPDLIHVHGVWGPACRAARWIMVQSRIPIVLSPHGMVDSWALGRSRVKKRIAWHVWAGRVLRHARALHALCPSEARSIADLVGAGRVVTIPNGVTPPPLDMMSRGDQNTALFLGRIHPKKGLDPLIEAWAMSAASQAGWHLDIAGWDDGGYVDGLKARVASLGVADSVHFLGPTFGQDKATLLSQSSAFILPSFSEGLPMAVLEAWSYGVPVLMTDACNLAEGFHAKAALDCTTDPESIREGLDKLLVSFDRGQRVAMGANGRKLIDGHFTWARVARDMAGVYDRAIAGTTNPALLSRKSSGAEHA